MIETCKQYEALIQLLCKAIKNRNLLKFYYESEASKRKEWRTIKPYMVWPNSNSNLSLAGEPLDFKLDKNGIIMSGQYLLSQLIERLNEKRFEVLIDKFQSLRVPRDRVDNTKAKVICRFIYDDEDEEEVRKDWLKVTYI